MSRARVVLLCLLMTAPGLGCWEQVSVQWFAQMKQQPAVQALEDFPPLAPPEGTIPVGGMEPRIDSPVPAFTPQAVALPNPIPNSLESRARGKVVFETYCSVCHGKDGMAGRGPQGNALEVDAKQVPVAAILTQNGMTPFPLKNVPIYSDGFLFTKIRYGKPMMPGYPQIPAADRWHVVNYLRELIKGARP